MGSLGRALCRVVEEHGQGSQSYCNLHSLEDGTVHLLCWTVYQISYLVTLVLVLVKRLNLLVESQPTHSCELHGCPTLSKRHCHT